MSGTAKSVSLKLPAKLEGPPAMRSNCHRVLCQTFDELSDQHCASLVRGQTLRRCSGLEQSADMPTMLQQLHHVEP